MLIGRFLNWADQVSAGERAEGTGALALAYLYADLDPLDQGEAERVLTILLDDPSPLVRRAMAEAFATAVDAPHHIVVALAGDQPAIAAVVLGRSPILSDAELIDAVAVGDSTMQAAVAARPSLSAAVAGALAEVGQPAAVLALCRNPGARITEFAAQRLLNRFADDGAIRAELAARGDLSASLRHTLVLATITALTAHVETRAWITPERLARIATEERDRATITIAVESFAREGESAQRRFAAHLIEAGQLTAALLLRTLLSGHLSLFEAALCELSGRSGPRVGGLVRNREGLGFAALYTKAGLPPPLLPVFRAALAAAEDFAHAPEAEHEARLQRRVISHVLAACQAIDGPELGKVMVLLRRFEAEAARDDARDAARLRQAEQVAVAAFRPVLLALSDVADLPDVPELRAAA